MAPYPDGQSWKVVTDKAAPGQHIREQVPDGQTGADYRDILADQAFYNLKKDVGPSTMLRGVMGETTRRCGDVRVNGPTEKSEGGYAVAYAQVYCNRVGTEPFGVIMNFKAIQGEDALYVVNREFRVAPTQKAGVMTFGTDKAAAESFINGQAAANAYLVNNVHLCGPRSPADACAGGG